MAVHTHPSIPCPICGFGLRDETKVLSFQKFVNENEEHEETEEPLNVELDPNDPDVETLKGVGLLPKRLNEPLYDRIQEMFGDFTADEVIQAKIEELKKLLEAHIDKYVDDEESEEDDWVQTKEFLYEKGLSDPDEIDLLEWYLITQT